MQQNLAVLPSRAIFLLKPGMDLPDDDDLADLDFGENEDFDDLDIDPACIGCCTSELIFQPAVGAPKEGRSHIQQLLESACPSFKPEVIHRAVSSHLTSTKSAL